MAGPPAPPRTGRPRSGHENSPHSCGGARQSATKYAAAWALTEGLRQEPGIRVTTISPGVVDTELADHITAPEVAEAMRTYRAALIRPEDIANAIKYALDQPSDVDVSEIILRPSAQRP
ncbi:short chain dehydrogenase [Nonomuraea sp. NBC_00507]|uniref:SDR family oxidoreductase n=1 Tax=Nonomuraea sp. NBC_00507 TaxID=2976002 RepID=UPI002E185589